MAFDAKMAQKRNCVWLQALQCLFVQRWLPLGISQSTTEAVNSKQFFFFGFLLFFIVYLVYHLEKKKKKIFNFSFFFTFFLLLKVPWLPSPKKSDVLPDNSDKLQLLFQLPLG